ncbi:hypothetical protein Sjap_014191 [Stephania japonica]|uniref:Protein kinase domain-containing protein n=1 Tax=Stephania japonica TaxID=461633 RepID=A0AAP0IZH2_9MAGN
MDELWNLYRLKIGLLLVLWCSLCQNLQCCWSLNAEGLALLRFRERIARDPYGALTSWNSNGVEETPCFWSGIECADGKVVVLCCCIDSCNVKLEVELDLQLPYGWNLKDLCLEGALGPELGNLVHVKSIVLRNNSFSGSIPKEIGELNELELLDLGYNNFNGPLPSNLGNNLSLALLLLDNNRFLSSISYELHELSLLSEVQVDESLLSNVAHQASCNQNCIRWQSTECLHIFNYLKICLGPLDVGLKHLHRNNVQDGDSAHRRLLQAAESPPHQKAKPQKSKARRAAHSDTSPSPSPSPEFSLSPSPSPSHSPLLAPISSSSSFAPTTIFLPPEQSPSPAPAPTAFSLSPAPAEPPIRVAAAPPSHSTHVLSPSALPALPSQPKEASSHSKRRLHWPILTGSLGASFLLISVIGILLCRNNKVVAVKPWATGLSGQLQKAFVTGVPKLKREELETACEDFSNIIGSFSNGKVYKGTLSSGVEIAVTSTVVTSNKDWTKQMESQYRKRIDTLSKVNHKNFLNLLGFCEEEKPFTRMLVFEYAPNGTLFEHLHIMEAEHLDWGARLRIAMGMAYCLEHMHQLSPPVIHMNLQSSSVYLTEDYAAKISDHGLSNEVEAATKTESNDLKLLEEQTPNQESNVYSFGVILLEIVTGKLPYSTYDGAIVGWSSPYLRGVEPCKQMVDPTLTSFKEEQVNKLFEVIKSCIHHDPKQRPSMRDVTARLREITEMAPDGATPKVSPLWWAELEILSTEAA